MNLTIIGTGYVGLVSGACFAKIGHNVTCVDKDSEKIQALKNAIIPIYEPELKEIVKESLNSGSINFTNNLERAVEKAEIILLAVGTPTDEKTGNADLRFIEKAVEELALIAPNKSIIVTKSTVPVGTGKMIKDILLRKYNRDNIYVASNPEFLREGCAVGDFMNPDRIVIGTDNEYAKTQLEKLYKPLSDKNVKVVSVNIETAELIKYAANGYLAMKIAFVNEMADICEKVGANINDVTYGVGLDARIGSGYMQPGPGYGGSCFPKDTLALTNIAKDAGAPSKIVEAVIESNQQRRDRMITKILNFVSNNVEDLNIAILGLTFKANTDDMRYSPSLSVVPALLKRGANISVYDPEGMDNAKKMIFGEDIYWAKNTPDCCKNADLLVILTEWEEFKNIDLASLRSDMRGNKIVDLRNILNQNDVNKSGFEYSCIGSK